jgi:peptidyl-prolyl cis-trans isomerase SurA
MPWFTAGRMIKKFADAAFAIKEKGDFTKPIETKFGYHIIKKLDERGIASFEDSKADIESRIKRDPARSITSKTAFANKLKLEYNYSENSDGIAKLKGKKIGDRFEDVNFDMFVLNGKTYNFGGLRKYIQKNKITTGTYSSKYDKWVEDEITTLEDSRLEEKYPEFRYLMQEYHDGILLFNISEEKIWNRAVEDTVGLEAFYTKNSKKYSWEERFKGVVIKCKDKATKDEADKFFAAGMPIEEITDQLNSDEEMITIEEGAWEKGSNPAVDYLIWNEDKPAGLNDELTFVRGDKIPPESKSLNEARGLYISDYQNFLEEKWIKELRKKYTITIDEKLLKTIKGV